MAREYEDDDNEGGSDNETPLVKDLRKQLRAAKRELDEATEKITSLEKGSRERSVKDVLKAKGVREGIAKWIPEDVKSEDEITKWLEENADDLGITLSTGDDAGGDQGDPDPAQGEQQRASQLGQRTVPAAKLADLEARIGKAETPEEIAAIYAEAKNLTL